MTREAKIGLMMVSILIGVFGFLVYKRIHRPAELQAGSSRDAAVATAEPIEQEPGESPDLEPAQFARPYASPKHRIEKPTTQIEDEDLERVESQEIEGRLKGTTRPTKVRSFEDEEVARTERTWNSHGRPKQIEIPDIESESRALPTLESDSTVDASSDPFDDGPTVADAASEDDEPGEIVQVNSQADESPSFDNGAFEPPALETEDRSDLRSEPVNTFRSNSNSAQDRKRAAPATVDNSSFEAESNSKRISGGETYTIQPSDNFWSISRRRYGAGRYFMALAMHNRKTIPDPKRMKPGMVISTPDAETLERLYPDAISKLPAESSDSIRSSQSRQSVQSNRPGYFLGESGEPMYRIGPNDTLTEIAKTHLHRSSRWVQILNMNRNVLRDGNELKVGTILRLPADASRVRIAGTSENLR